MENFDQEMFEIDQQLRSLEEYDTSSDSDVDETEEVEDDQTQQPEQQNTFPGYVDFGDLMTFDVVQPTASGPRVKNDRITGLASSVPPGNSNTVIKIELKNEPVNNLTTPTPFTIATSSAPAATSSSISQAVLPAPPSSSTLTETAAAAAESFPKKTESGARSSFKTEAGIDISSETETKVKLKRKSDDLVNLHSKQKRVKRRGHLEPEDIHALEEERGFRMVEKTQEKTTSSKGGGGSGKKKKKEIDYVCLSCNHTCNYLSAATDHVNVHHRKIPLECTECDYVTFRWKNISHHRLKFHNLKGMPCPVEGCHFTGVVTWQMTRHMEDKHGGSHKVESLTFPAPEAKTSEERNLENQPSKRNDWARENGYQMGNSRKTGGYLTKYYEITHDPVTKRRQYHCTMCDHQHKSAANLLNHINGVHLKQNMKCVWCDFTTLNSNTLNDHSSKKHQYEKKQCIVPGCKYKTIQEETYQMHLALKHNAVYDPSDHSIKIFQEIPQDQLLTLVAEPSGGSDATSTIIITDATV